MGDVSFRPLAAADLCRLGDWLREEHVQRWWSDPSPQDRVEAKYLPRISGAEPTQVFVILWDRHPVGIIQRYRISDYPDWADALAPSSWSSATAAGIDYLLGEPELVGQGIGTAAIARFSSLVFDDYADVDTIVVTPQEANRASCRALQKAGYRLSWTGVLDSEDPSDAGIAALYLLRRPT